MKNDNPAEIISIPSTLPLLPLKDAVIYPYMIMPLIVSREMGAMAVESAMGGDRLVFMASQKSPDADEPKEEDVYAMGCVASIMRMRKLPDGRLKILAQGVAKARITDWKRPKGVRLDQPQLVGVEVFKDDEETPSADVETEALMRGMRENMEKLVSIGKNMSPDVLLVINSVNDPGRLADLIASNIILKVDEAQKILEILPPKQRLEAVSEALAREIEVIETQADIQNKARERMSKSQREYFLREQLKQIKEALGESDWASEEIGSLRRKIAEAALPKHAADEAEKQLRRLDGMQYESSEAGVIRTYLDWLADLPWTAKTDDKIDLAEAKRTLDEDHYDMEEIKDRILEFLAVLKLNPNRKGTIICFAGPPGVGKTSLGKSVARATGRKFVRASLGGIKDEAEIRGHRRTYIGAMPGKIIYGMKQAGSRNPVFMLDEIDKLGSDFHGDPSAALLETLDPEQNGSFVDHYINLPFDLSDVMFIATANNLDSIPAPLLDRMEVIPLSGYSLDEKVAIARRFLIPKQTRENGLDESRVAITDAAVRKIALGYTREAGLRGLERNIGSICRKIARKVAEGDGRKTVVGAAEAQKFLGPPYYVGEEVYKNNMVGVSAGLAWTPSGGEILYVEARLVPGRGALQLTGKLGEVMRESAFAALSYVKSTAAERGVDQRKFDNFDAHVHVPSGATPKDGPSAGVAIAVTLLSLYSGVPVRCDTAMTGEITLTGKILPVGGLKEKLLAAARYGIKRIIAPNSNAPDLTKLDAKLKRKIEIITVADMDEAFDAALERNK